MTYLRNEPLQDVRMLPPYDERYVFLTAADGRFARAKEVTWSDAARERLCLLTPDMQHRRIVDSTFAAVGETPRVAIETNSVSTLYAHASAGLASAVMAHAWLPLLPVPADMRVIPLVEPDVRQAVGLVWAGDWPEPLVPRTLIGLARETDLGALLERAPGTSSADVRRPAETQGEAPAG